MFTGGASRIFISYRRQEANFLAGHLYDKLANHFGKQRVFIDVEMGPGLKWREVIASKVGACDVLLAVIGPQWLRMTDSQGQRRLEDPDDFVRLEIEAALQRDVRVIPVLTNGAVMPRRSELPKSLAKLADRHAFTIHFEGLHHDVARLISEIDPGLRWRGLSLTAGLLLILAAGSFIAESFLSVTGAFREWLPTLIADSIAAVAVGAVGVGILAARTRPSIAIGGGILLGASPFIGLRMWRSAQVRDPFGWGSESVPVLAIVVALGLVALLLAVNPDERFGYQRPTDRAGPMLILVGAFAPVALSLVGSTIPTSDSDFGTLKFSDPMVLAYSVILAALVAFTQGALQGAILAGWAGGAAFVLANTVWLRIYSDPPLAPILNAQLLLCGFTVAILAATARLALRGDRPFASSAGAPNPHKTP
ncbi:toll/interleukin-1 receptor domain-containing protein [Geodermatophilus obscurus]|uniref:TIR domain-containing protein n=1 Tax=Geodermatophilus obscurus (strain ATCC 25078 / DSM 43160 / JCM 3152 / CCUG 61914 / KCC A-0152 / KCTC 9177 / NBRC 13315 / NRRL B-3577 / G-20) TaxID=526225 RepID=D2SB37_GEOOG|nr:toll/interleukin-1 receptor domain-containing protein [Geodermatophilus obscurus]ADB76072.1 hypothetical protein Gobs_3474 [Geodermatophilus obscurus DSM 43160]